MEQSQCRLSAVGDYLSGGGFYRLSDLLFYFPRDGFAVFLRQSLLGYERRAVGIVRTDIRAVVPGAVFHSVKAEAPRRDRLSLQRLAVEGIRHFRGNDAGYVTVKCHFGYLSRIGIKHADGDILLRQRLGYRAFRFRRSSCRHFIRSVGHGILLRQKYPLRRHHGVSPSAVCRL